MSKKSIIYVFFFLISILHNPQFMYAQTIQIDNDLTTKYISKKIFSSKTRANVPEASSIQFGTDVSSRKVSSRLALNMTNGKNSVLLDDSYLKYKFKLSEIGFGKIARKWSFSPNESLAISKNSAPINSIYFKIRTNKVSQYRLFSWIGPWSFEVFNGLTNVDRGPDEAMLLGTRAVIEPAKKFKIEFIQMAQWGGIGNETGINGLASAFLGNTNEGPTAHINRMAGIGFSYHLPKKFNAFRIYGQAIGEDEAGSLPSCFMHLAGIEWDGQLLSKNLTLILEKIDTRIDVTAHGFCGSNTAYNNFEYSYTHNGKVMGASIDTEGTSLELSAMLKISSPLSLELSLKDIVINDNNWDLHRLSTQRERGFVNTAALIWSKDMLSTEVGISYQNLNLDKVNYKKGTNVYMSASIVF